MPDVRAMFLDGPWEADGAERWVGTPPPESITTPGGSTHRLVDSSADLVVYQDEATEFG